MKESTSKTDPIDDQKKRKTLRSRSTYEFFLNTSMIVMVAALAFMVTSFDFDDGFWSRFFQSVVFVLLMVFFSSQSIMREVVSPFQRTVFWTVIVVFVAPVTFATLYLFVGDYGQCLQNSDTVSDHLYFSYVTFTTLGYGDIQPIGICRGLSAAEAVLGYIFLGALVGAFSNLSSKH